MSNALRVYAARGDRIIRVIGRPSQSARSEIEVTLHEWPLRNAMIAYGLRILYLSLAISVATGALLFFAVQRFIVRPISRVVEHMTAYQDDPEDASRIIEPQGGARELVQAETALHDLQVRLTGALRQKERLAALGGAVAKISHDLRNLLTTAQILADRIDASTDPGVKRTAPKLLSSLSRAISLCERTLTFGRAEEPPPEPAVFPLAPLVEEVLAGERLATPGPAPASSPRSRRISRCGPTPTSSFGCCRTWCATPRRRSRRRVITGASPSRRGRRRARPRSVSPTPARGCRRRRGTTSSSRSGAACGRGARGSGW